MMNVDEVRAHLCTVRVNKVSNGLACLMLAVRLAVSGDESYLRAGLEAMKAFDEKEVDSAWREYVFDLTKRIVGSSEKALGDCLVDAQDVYLLTSYVEFHCSVVVQLNGLDQILLMKALDEVALDEVRLYADTFDVPKEGLIGVLGGGLRLSLCSWQFVTDGF